MTKETDQEWNYPCKPTNYWSQVTNYPCQTANYCCQMTKQTCEMTKDCCQKSTRPRRFSVNRLSTCPPSVWVRNCLRHSVAGCRQVFERAVVQPELAHRTGPQSDGDSGITNPEGGNEGKIFAWLQKAQFTDNK